MKWIGQHIVDLIARFRSDVYLEDISSGTIASGGNLGLDSNNKIVKAEEASGDITGVTAGTGLSGGGTSGAVTLNVDAEQTQIVGVGTITTGVWNGDAITAAYIAAAQTNITSLGTLTALTVDNIGINGDTITASGDLTISATGNDVSVDTDNFVISSSVSQKPFLELKNTHSDNKGSILQFTKDKGAAGADNDTIGFIKFVSDDAAQTQTVFARITGQVSEADNSDEAGKLALTVANDGTLRNGITMEGSKATAAEVDVTIANGAASVTTLAGTLTMGSTATIDNSGVWVGGVIPSAKLDADTAHLSGAQTFTGTKTLNSFKGTGGATVTNILDEDAMGSDSATALATQQSIKAYVDTRLHYIHTAYKAQTGMDTERYVSLVDADREATGEDNVAIVAIIPATGVLKRVIVNSSSDLSGKEWTYKLKRIPSGTAYTSEILVATVVKDAGGASNTNSIVDFVTDDGTTNDLDFESGYSTSTQITAGDRVLFSVQANSPPSGQPKMNLTLVFEIDDATVL